MKRKLLAMAVACSVLAFLVMPGVFAQNPSDSGSGTIDVTGGDTTIALAGVYENGIYFNFSAATEETKQGQADTGTTNFSSATDYVEVRSTEGSTAWEVHVYSSDFTDGVTTYTPSTTTSTTNIQLTAPATDQGSVAQAAAFVSNTGNACDPDATNIAFRQITDNIEPLPAGLAEIFASTNTDDNLSGCSLYRARATVPFDLAAPNNGFPVGSYTGTLTFVLL